MLEAANRSVVLETSQVERQGRQLRHGSRLRHDPLDCSPIGARRVVIVVGLIGVRRRTSSRRSWLLLLLLLLLHGRAKDRWLLVDS